MSFQIIDTSHVLQSLYFHYFLRNVDDLSRSFHIEPYGGRTPETPGEPSSFPPLVHGFPLVGALEHGWIMTDPNHIFFGIILPIDFHI